MSQWKEALDRALNARTALLVGEADTGKTTFFKEIWALAKDKNLTVGMIDGDLGQKTIGPPATAGLVITANESREILRFVGDTTPVSRQVEVVLAVKHLADQAWRSGCETVVVDTSGLVSGSFGTRLKRVKAELLEADMAIILEREDELSGLAALYESRGIEVLRVPASREARRISSVQRAQNRGERFSRYFERAVKTRLTWEHITPIPPDKQALQQSLLVGLLDAEWSTLAMGIVMRATPNYLEVLAPSFDANRAKVVEAGTLRLEADGTELGRVR